jgi:hypothetical protein
MVKRLLFITLTLLLLLAAGLAGAGWWLLKDEAGVRWLLAELSRRSAVTVEARQIEGRLLDRVRLADVSVSWPGGAAVIDNFELVWHPVSLFRAHLDIDQLSLVGGKVAWLAPPARTGEGEAGPFAFAWPRLAGWPLRLQAGIESLRIESVELQPPTGKAERLERLTAKMDWRSGTFSVAELEVDAAGYRLQGSAAAGLGRPLLRLDLQLRLPTARAGVDALELKADLVP